MFGGVDDEADFRAVGGFVLAGEVGEPRGAVGYKIPVEVAAGFVGSFGSEVYDGAIEELFQLCGVGDAGIFLKFGAFRVVVGRVVYSFRAVVVAVWGFIAAGLRGSSANVRRLFPRGGRSTGVLPGVFMGGHGGSLAGGLISSFGSFLSLPAFARGFGVWLMGLRAVAVAGWGMEDGA